MQGTFLITCGSVKTKYQIPNTKQCASMKTVCILFLATILSIGLLTSCDPDDDINDTQIEQMDEFASDPPPSEEAEEEIEPNNNG